MLQENENVTQQVVYDAALAELYRVVKPLVDVLIEDASQRENLVHRVAAEVSDRYGQQPFTCDEVEKLLSTELDRLATRYEQGLRDDALFAADEPEEYQSFSTRCPFCGTVDRLAVIQVTLSYHQGLVLGVNAALMKDGFDIYLDVPNDLCDTDLSTEDEVVSCLHCHQQFDLSLVTVG